MIDICFIVTPIPELKEDKLEPPLGYMYLGSYLQKFGYDVKIVDLCGGVDYSVIPEARFYGFSTYTSNYRRTVEIKNYIASKYPNAKFIAGGAHASALPNDVVKDFDYVVIAEGEIGLKKILDGIELPSIIQGEHIANLDAIPFPDYDLVNINNYDRKIHGRRCFSILSSRGCPYNCLYCNSIIMGAGKRVRYRSPQNVIEEVKRLIDRYGDISFRFQDDLFASNEKWLKEFTGLIQPLGIEYRAFARVTQCCDVSHVRLLKEGGCTHLGFGVESGSDKILKAMNKGQTVAQIKQGIKNVKDAGITARIYLIVGFPGETWETVKETIRVIKEINPDEYTVYPLVPYPGSNILAKAGEFGLRNISLDYSKYFQIRGNYESDFVYDLDYADRDKLAEMLVYLKTELDNMKITPSIQSGVAK